jgi:hypothetical protein
MQMIDEASKAACAIAAHLGLSAIGVVVAHFEVASFRGRLNAEQSVSSNAAMAVAEFFDLRGGEGKAEVTIVQHDEVIAGAVHFGEVEGHRGTS